MDESKGDESVFLRILMMFDVTSPPRRDGNVAIAESFSAEVTLRAF